MNDNVFSVSISTKIEKKLYKKFKPYQDQIKNEMKKLAKNPIASYKNFKIEKLRGFDEEIYRFKVFLPDGSCRCVYKLDRSEKEVLIIEFDFRSKIDYKKIRRTYN